MALGTFILAENNNTGIINVPRHCWGGVFTNNPDNIFNENNATRRIIHAIALRETLNNFEILNCWDKAYLSLGYFHWTIGARSGIEDEGELQGFLTYLKRNFNTLDYNKYIRFFGLDTSHALLNNTFEAAESILQTFVRKMIILGGL